MKAHAGERLTIVLALALFAVLTALSAPATAISQGAPCVVPVRNGPYELPTRCGQNVLDIPWDTPTGTVHTLVTAGTDLRIHEGRRAQDRYSPWQWLDGGTVVPDNSVIAFTVIASTAVGVTEGYLRVPGRDGLFYCKRGHQARWVTAWYLC